MASQVHILELYVNLIIHKINLLLNTKSNVMCELIHTHTLFESMCLNMVLFYETCIIHKKNILDLSTPDSITCIDSINHYLFMFQ
jgi:hypothetical protein